MKRDTVSGTLLIAGALAGLLVMMHHPTGHAMMTGAGDGHMARLNVFVHGLALVMMPVVFLGLLGAARRLAPSELATAALVAFGFGTVAVMGAAIASGFVATDLIVGEGGIGTSRDALLAYTHLWNQGFAHVFVAADSIGILLLSAAILRTGRIGRLAGAVGLVVGAGILIAVAAGLHLDVHGFGLVTIARSAWLAVLGALLSRGAEPARA